MTATTRMTTLAQRGARRERGPQLIWRIAIALAAVGLLPLVLSSLQLVAINREAMKEQVLRAHILAARATAGRVESFVGARSALVQAAATNPELANPASDAARSALTGLLQSGSALGALVAEIAGPRGEEVLRAQLKSDEARDAVSRSRALAPGESVRVDLAGGTPLVIFEAPLGQGAVRLLCRGDGLRELLLPEELGESADLVLATRQRAVIAGSLASLADMPEPLVAAAVSGRARGAQATTGKSGEELLGAWAPVEGTDWFVISRQPLTVAEAVARNMRSRAALALAGALALIALSAIGAWLTIVRPLRRLLLAQRALTHVPKGAGGSEIAELEAGFAALEKSVRARDDLSRVFLGRYQVLETIGSGGMGSVFRGHDPRLDRQVALKTLRPGAEEDPGKRTELLTGLRREAITVARLNHPNIVAVHDIVEAPSGVCIAMEFVDGPSLEELLWEHGPLSGDQATCLAFAVACALAAAHAQGVVHRDVKPGNVLLSRDGSIKVTDFGIAALLTGASTSTPERFFGTPGFVPPEVYRGETYGPPGDLFALGTTLYEAMTGIEPFAGRNLREIAQRTVAAPIKQPREIRPELPEGLNAAVLSLLDRAPANRPSAAALATVLEERMRTTGARWQPPRASSPSTTARPEGTVSVHTQRLG